MITLIVMGSVILILGLAMYQPILVKIKWGSSGKLFSVRYFLLSFHRPKKRKKRVKKEEKKEKGGRDWRAVLEWIKLSPMLIYSAGKGLRILLKYSEVNHIKIEGTLGAKDAVTTGILWGMTQAVCGNLSQWISGLEMNLSPDFIEGKTELALNSQMRLRMGGLLASTAVILWYLPKRQLWRIIRK